MSQYTEELMERLDFPPESRRVFRDVEKRLGEDTGWHTEFCRIEDIFLRCPAISIRPLLNRMDRLAEKMGIHPYTLHLLFYMECSRQLRERYREHGVDEALFWESMKDLRVKLDECLEVYGISGTRAGHWHSGFFVDRIALGRLQYEPRAFAAECYKKAGYQVSKGDMVINIHIPSGAPLTQESCQASYAMAHAFFRPLFEEGQPTAFVCDSWLLDPESDTFLSPCNIIRFKHNFDIIESRVDEAFHDKWRVFGKDWDKEISQLPRKTSIQKAYADHLAQGGAVRTGYGIFLFNGTSIIR